MPIKSIEKIKIGNYPDGKFADGYIYSAQINQGYSENINKLTIEIVYQQGSNPILPEKNLTSAYRVIFGDLIFPQMYFIAHSKSIGVNEETISCTFVDGSSSLDRYFVGLTNRHYKVKEQSQAFSIQVPCANCDNTISTKGGIVQRSLANSPNILVNNLIVVGEEEFIDQACDVPDVKYSFSDLLAAMTKIPNFSFQNLTDVNPLYKTSYTGTLREVLSNWCSDFGFSFYWDFLTNTLIGYDLREPVDLTVISDFIKTNFDQKNSNSNLKISNFSEDESLEGTYQQDYVDYVLKPSRTKESPFVDFFPITYSCINVSNAFLNDYANYGDAFKIGCVLSKYNQQLRTLYHLQGGRFNLIGFNKIYNGIETYVLQTVFQNIYEMGESTIIIGNYDESIDRAQASRESSIASDFIGRYYYNTSYVLWKELYCNENARLTLSTTSVPEPDCTNPNPWKEYGGSFNLPPPASCLFNRGGAAYQEIDSSNLAIDNLGPFFTYIDGEIANQVRDALLIINPNNTNADKYRGLTLIAYKPNLSVNSLSNVQNEAEEGLTPSQYESDTSASAACATICERDTAAEICKKTCTQLVALAHGLVSKSSEGIRVTNTSNGSTMTIYFPSEQNYLGYIKANGSFFYTQQGVKEMNLTSDSNFKANDNIMTYNINVNDITAQEPSVNTIINSSIRQNSNNLNITQKNSKKSISLKIIGTNYGGLKDYLKPNSGLISLNVYLNDNGVFTDLNFENRPAQKPKGEVTMQKVGPQKMRIIK